MPRTIKTYDEYEFGLSWVLDEPAERTSHALVVDGGVWLIDPVAVDEALERVRSLGPPAGVIQLLDRHNRDCAKLAAELGVPHLRVPDAAPPFDAIPVVRLPVWKETALWWPEKRALIVAEVLASGHAFTAGASRVGVHFVLRPFPPGRLRAYEPEHLLMGHGAGVHGPDAAVELRRAYARSRRDLPRVLAKLPFAGR